MTTMTKKQRMDERILLHGFALQRIFPKANDIGPVSLCKVLRRIENRAHRRAEIECCEDYDQDAHDRADERDLDRLDDLLDWRAVGAPVFINGDPRGYALKIDDAWIRENKIDIHRDWGGYGILAPDLTDA